MVYIGEEISSPFAIKTRLASGAKNRPENEIGKKPKIFGLTSCATYRTEICPHTWPSGI
jgi:hypothetical protein